MVSSGAEEGVHYLDVENEVQPGSGPPMHVHHQQKEALTILQGRMGVEVLGEAISFHEAGETVAFAPGIAHRFWNAGHDVLRCTGRISPALNFEYFITEIFKSMQASKDAKPAPFDAAYLLTRYKSEFDMVSIPKTVKKVMFPVIIFAGKLTGKDKKFIGAPPSI